MHEFEMLFKEAEVANLQFESAVANIMVNDAVFEESGDGDGFFAKLKKAVCDFVDNMTTSIKNIFLKFSGSKAREKAEKAATADSKFANKKVKATDWKKIHILNKEVQKKINAAKSKEEVDRIMREYKAKRNKIIAATTAATVTVGALLIFFTRGKSKNVVPEMEEQKKGMDYGKTQESPDPVKDQEIKKAKATADAEIRKTEVKDTVDETKENIQIISDEAAKALADKMNGSSIKIPSSKNGSLVEAMKNTSEQEKIMKLSRTLKATDEEREVFTDINRFKKRIRTLEKMLDDPDLMQQNKATKESVKRDLTEILEDLRKYPKTSIAPRSISDTIGWARFAIEKCK